jgi:hypothetical protein
MQNLETKKIINQISIPLKILLLPYLIVPCVIFLILIDYLFLNQRIQQLLQAQPVMILIAGILFGLPHIVASLFAYGDKNYRAYYKNNFKLVLPASLGMAVLTINILPELAGYILYSVLTLVHTIGQQVGLSRSGIRISNKSYFVWRWSSTLMACCTVISIANIRDWKMPLLVVAAIALSVSSFFAIRLIAEAGGAKKAIYLIATQAMLLTAFACFLTGYSLLGVLIPRIVHDCTAFIMYTGHDRAHTLNSKNNTIYARLRIEGKHVYWFLPIVSIVLAVLLNMTGLLAITITYFHYFMEKTAWSRDSMHRKLVKFS